MNFSKFINKFKKQNKLLRCTFLIIWFAYFISVIFFSRSILSLVGIETLIRVLGLAVLYTFVIMFFFIGIVLLFTRKNKSLIFMLVVVGLLTGILSIASFYIDKTYGIVSSVQKKYVNYTSYMVSLKDTNEYKKIGIINSKNDPTGYIIPQDMIKKYKITGETVKYDDYFSMMSDLYDGKIDALFIASSFKTMFNTYDKFKNIKDETKVVYELSKKLENVDNISYSSKNLTEPFTLLLMGVDATGDGISSGSSFNGDTLMLITFNPKTLNATIFSIPRDTFVPISCFGNAENKINSAAYGGTSCVVETIQNLTDIKIDYYVKINFNGVVSLVDDVGGIDVDVPVSFCEQDSQRRFGEYEICLEAGKQKLNGEQALALSRHRKTLLTGDFQRVQHQQLVVQGLLSSLKNVKDVEQLYKILEDISKNIDTNMSTSQILSLYNVGKNIMLNNYSKNSTLSITKTYLTGYDLTIYLPSVGSYTYTFQYYKNSLKEITDAMKINLEIIKPEPIKTFSFSANEVYEPKVVGQTYYDEAKSATLPNFTGYSKAQMEQYSSSNGISVNYKSVSKGDSLYNASLENGTVVSQYPYMGALLSDVDTITIYIIDNINSASLQEDNNTNNGNNSDNSDNSDNKDNESNPLVDILPSDDGIDDEDDLSLSYSGLDDDSDNDQSEDNIDA